MKIILSTITITLMAAATASAAFNAADFPPPNAIPPTDSPQVKEWLKAINFTGPTTFTPQLLDTLLASKIKATFFVMGGNVVQNPLVLKREQDEGHHIASHTWSHNALTTLTNEQIVAELKWTEKAVQDITGLQMKYVRPPYGDMDNRVRAVIKKLGYIVVDWTSDAYDSKDFALNASPTEAKLAAAVTSFSTALTAYGAAPGDKGIITLEHDLYQVTVDFAKRIIPVATQAKLKIQSIDQCLGDKSPYQNSPPPANNSTGGNAGNSTSGGNTGNGGKNAASSVGVKVVMTVSLAVIAAALSAF
ncbi:chitin deacetylase [Linnemannia gamsii]|uniref:Chitin deacetylase n=1 Tax=Linnemannia gamsii TaxID=64522 RepID=A0ABQ7K7D1_9FUNG|nr:chitin deacetylase [Linnemannia gamsii]